MIVKISQPSEDWKAAVETEVEDTNENENENEFKSNYENGEEVLNAYEMQSNENENEASFEQVSYKRNSAKSNPMFYRKVPDEVNVPVSYV